MATTQATGNPAWMPRAAPARRDGPANAKGKVSAFAMLPSPLDEESLGLVLAELNHGSKRAVESCLECWKGRRMSDDDLLEFLRSISSQSGTLQSLFKSCASAKAKSFEVASADDMAELRALADSFGAPEGAPDAPVAVPAKRNAEAAAAAAPAAQAQGQQQGQQVLSPRIAKRARVVDAAASAAAVPEPALPVPPVEVDIPHAPPAKAAPPKRTRRPKITEPTEEETRLMREWSERRVTEIARRQAETCGAPGKPKHLAFVISQLRARLPASEQGALLDAVRSYNAGESTPEDFAAFCNEQIERHAIVVPLTHRAEVNVRPRKRVVPVRLAMGSDAIEMMKEAGSDVSSPDDPEAGARPVAAKKACRGHPARGGGQGQGVKPEPGLGGETVSSPEGDDDARCPVCVSCPLEDDRWVKCDGCSTWYHQICVLFNELAHGKSVRFFCRTPGCRKRGSRQLNRRQRKPCYPTSLSLTSDPLAEAVAAAAVSVSRTDRSVVARVASCSTQTRGDAKKKSLTVMVFQHTMTGSDLLFLTVMLEVQGQKFSVVGADSNGLYEESYQGERAAVEVSVFEGLMRHARDAGFTTVSLTNPQAVGDFALFYGRPAHGAWGPGDAEATFEGALATAKQEGGVYGVHRDGAGFVAKLRPLAGATGSLAVDDTPCKAAGERDSLVGLMDANGYSFGNLQCAKYASMMVVYHLAKGWKKDGAREFSSYRPRHADAGAGSEEEEEEEPEEQEGESFPVPPPAASRQNSGLEGLISRQHSFDGLSRQGSERFQWGSASGEGIPGLRREGSGGGFRGDGGQSFDLMSHGGKSRQGSVDLSRTTPTHFDGAAASTTAVGGGGGTPWHGVPHVGVGSIEACFQTLVSSAGGQNMELQQPFGLRHADVRQGFGFDRQGSFDYGRNISFDLSAKGAAPFEVGTGGGRGSKVASRSGSFDLGGNKSFDHGPSSKGASFDLLGSKGASFDLNHPSTPKSEGGGLDLASFAGGQPAHQVRTLDASAGSFWDDFRV